MRIVPLHGRACAGGGLGLLLRQGGMLTVAGVLTIVAVGKFSGGRRGRREPDAEAGSGGQAGPGYDGGGDSFVSTPLLGGETRDGGPRPDEAPPGMVAPGGIPAGQPYAGVPGSPPGPSPPGPY